MGAGIDGRMDENLCRHRAGGIPAPWTSHPIRPERRRLLYRHHRVGANGDRRASCDANRASVAHGSIGNTASGHLAGHGKASGTFLISARDVGGADRIAIHRRVVPGWQGDRGDHVARQDSPQRRINRDDLLLDWQTECGEDGRARLLDRVEPLGAHGLGGVGSPGAGPVPPLGCA